jgi:hypothetical protein
LNIYSIRKTAFFSSAGLTSIQPIDQIDYVRNRADDGAAGIFCVSGVKQDGLYAGAARAVNVRCDDVADVDAGGRRFAREFEREPENARVGLLVSDKP